jgi:hypothetical protein
MTQLKETFVEPAEIISCTDMGTQWKINVIWSNPQINPKGFASDTYMTKSIEDKIPFEKGHYAITVSKGKLKKPDFDGSKLWMYWLTTHAVRTPAEQDALSQDNQPQVAEEEDLFEETTPQPTQPTHFEKIQVSQNDSITNQVILKEIGLTQRTMIEKDQIKYTTLSEAREDLIKESKLAQLQYRDSE